MVIDQSYVHQKSPRRQSQDSGSYTSSWQGNHGWQWGHGDQQQTKSPRKGRPRSARGPKHQQPQQQVQPQQPMAPMMPCPMGNQPMAQMPPMMAWGMQNAMQPMPPPYMPMPYQPPPPPPAAPKPQSVQQHPQQMTSVIGPNFSMPAMPKMPVAPLPPEDKVDPGLLELLRKDVAELPLHIQKAVKETVVKDSAAAQKDLQKAARNLGTARENYENALLARSQLYANWKQFITDAVQLWQDYAKQFTDQEKKLQEQVASAKEAFALAKQISASAHETAGAVQEIHSDEEEFGDTSNSAKRITETMEGLQNSLVSLQEQTAAIDVEEKLHHAKRPRTTQSKAPDATMGFGDACGSAPFGKAG